MILINKLIFIVLHYIRLEHYKYLITKCLLLKKVDSKRVKNENRKIKRILFKRERNNKS